MLKFNRLLLCLLVVVEAIQLYGMHTHLISGINGSPERVTLIKALTSCQLFNWDPDS